ncbi:MAG: YebC/PmpR family DNA-binding transcriptional regulator [Chloroflexota bacterium]|jgi:YebC/PmpR family DNA-binding regulatory protein|nr:YebC/PmpR family DNA-binding transcriptional regulator [Chloroflexota bacterium]MDP6757039.1 YebC/PmpR family DNA-binding transcriptional regulator [Chloroflexota bacterium]
MSGHSKWSTIKRAKAATDAKRGQLFSKLSGEIAVAARMGGADTDANYRLKMSISRARAANMPVANIERAIQRGSGVGGEADLVELAYEGYGPGGVAIFIDVITDNKNRSVAQVRNVLDTSGGHLGETGSVAWLFEPRGEISLDLGERDFDDVFMMAVDAGAEDVEEDDGMVFVWTRADRLDAVRQELVAAGLEIEKAELGRVAQAPLDLEERQAVQVLRLVDKLEDLDDVRKVDTNLNLREEVVAAYATA